MNRTKKKSDPKAFHASQESLASARQALAEYTFLIEPHEELGYVGSAVELPAVMANGTSRDECVANLEFALETALAAMAEAGKPLPDAASSTTRTEQVNIRLTTREKQLLMLESSRRGYRGISDLLRSRMLHELRTGSENQPP